MRRFASNAGGVTGFRRPVGQRRVRGGRGGAGGGGGGGGEGGCPAPHGPAGLAAPRVALTRGLDRSRFFSSSAEHARVCEFLFRLVKVTNETQLFLCRVFFAVDRKEKLGAMAARGRKE